MTAVSFIHPELALFGAAAALIPVLIHFINRRRYRRVRWSAMSFLLSAHRRSAQRMRLENWLLMALRMTALLIVGAALARPYVPSTTLRFLGVSRTHRILVVDNSLRMNTLTKSGTTRLQSAMSAAEQLLNSFPVGDPVSLVTVAEPAETLIGHAAYDRRIVRERLSTIQAGFRVSDFVQAISLAHKLVVTSETAAGNQAVYFISDFAARTWLTQETQTDPGRADGSHSEPGVPGETNPVPGRIDLPAAATLKHLAESLTDPESQLTLVRVDPAEVENVAVVDLAPDATLLVPGLPFHLNVTLFNASPRTASGLRLQLRQNGVGIRTEPVVGIAPWGSTSVNLRVEPSGIGSQLLEAQVIGAEDDRLAIDDVRYLALVVRDRVPVLLVEGRPSPEPLGGDAGFVSAALSAGVTPAATVTGSMAGMEGDRSGAGSESSWFSPIQGGMLIESRRVGPFDLANEPFVEFSAVILCNVPGLPEDTWRRLEDYVSNGGGLIFFAGDRFAPDHFNRYGYADGRGLFPGPLGAAVSRASGEPPLYFRLDQSPHSLVAEFAGAPESGLFRAGVDRYVPVQPAADRWETVLRYTDGMPALVAGRFGRGRVLFMTTTSNMDWNALPSRGDFVSLVVNMVGSVSSGRIDDRNQLVGDVLREPLTPAESGLAIRVHHGTDSEEEARLGAQASRVWAEAGPIESPGPVTIHVGREARPFAVNIDPNQSDLRLAEPDELRKAIGAPFRLVNGASEWEEASTRPPATELASLGIYAVLLLLFMEAVAAAWFSQRRHTPSS